MKFFDIVWKEVSLVKSQKVALLLIILYPFLVIGLLGSAFTGMDISKMKQTKIGVVNDLTFDSNIEGKLASLKEVNVVQYYDLNVLKEAIRHKEVVAGLRLAGDSPHKQIRVELLYDNSSLLSSRFFIEIAKAMMQRITVESAQKELASIWQTISALGGNINDEISNINGFKQKLANADASLNKLEKDLNALDFTEIDSTLATQQQNVTTYSSKTTTFKQEVAAFEDSFNEMRSEYADIKMQLSAYQSQMEALPSQISLAYASLSVVIGNLNSIKPLVPDAAAQTKLQESINALTLQQQQLKDWNAVIGQMLLINAKIQDDSSALNTTMAQADSLFAKVNAEANEVSAVLGSSNSSIEAMHDKLSVFKKSVAEVHALIAESRTSKADIESRLNESNALLSSFAEQIVEFGQVDPKVLAQPVVFYEARMFEVDSFGILVANSAVVVLILTCMLLTSILILLERNQNVTQRLSLSTTSKTMLLMGKITGQLLISLVEAVIIFIVAFTKISFPFPILGFSSIGFGLKSSATLPELFIAILIISLAFISIGIFISFFTKNQSTAILASLLFIVPMLFLSGIILPIEFMDPLMQMFSSALPLTIANNLLLGLMVKGIPLWGMGYEVCLLLSGSALIILFVLFKKE